MFKNYSISKTLTWMNMMVSTIALLTACASFVGYDLVTFRREAANNLSTQAQIAGSNSVSALLFDDPQAAQNTLSAFKSRPNILSAGIYTLDGSPFAFYAGGSGTSHTPVLPSIPPGQVETYRFDGNRVVLVRSIVSDGKPVGTIYIQSDSQALNARVLRYAGISAVVLMASLLAAFLVSFVFRRAVADPIVHLAQVAKAVSRDKNYSIEMRHPGAGQEVGVLVEAFNEMLAQIQERERALQKAHNELEQRVQERTRALALANNELEAFSYSVSHDLRAPLRSIDGFSQAILEDCADQLDANGKDHLRRVRSATQRMASLIDDMLNLSRVSRGEMRRNQVDLSTMAASIAKEIQNGEEQRNVNFVIAEGMTADGDEHLLRVAFENLLRNAWKFTSRHDQAKIEVGYKLDNGRPAYFVRDDGAGFDMKYATRLFGAFQRLHDGSEFPGTGVGLATVQRIIRRHGGEIRAEAEPEKGATFIFTLAGGAHD